MTDQPQSFPLQWPPGFARTKNPESGRFKTSYDTALANVVTSLRRFGIDSGRKVDNAILSSNMSLLDRHPADAGCAIWFTWDGEQRCIPVDRYSTVAANLQAAHHIIEARRVELRHGTLALVRATFQGFKALPAPKGKSWRDILNLSGRVTADQVERAFKERARTAHPDKGGDATVMAELNHARDIALAEIGA